MAIHWPFWATLGEGANTREVGYSAKKRGRYLAVVFLGPDGTRYEKSTGLTGSAKNPDVNFRTAAVRAIVRVWARVTAPARMTWEEAMAAYETARPDHRRGTRIAYHKAVRVMLETLAEVGLKPDTPADVTPQMATLFQTTWANGTFTRGSGSDAAEYDRETTTANFYVRQLRAVWRYFGTPTNPWKSVPMLKTDNDVKPVPTEDVVAAFFAYVRDRYPEWERLHLLLDLKALSGCRSEDIAVLRSDQVADGRVTWTAAQVKHRRGRQVAVPPEMFVRLRAVAGPTWLWEHWPADCQTWRRGRGRGKWRGGSLGTLVTSTVSNIFDEFSATRPGLTDFTPHAFRRRAATLMVTATGSVDLTAEALGIHPIIIRKYYLQAKRAFNTDAAFREHAGILLPKTSLHPPSSTVSGGTLENPDEPQPERTSLVG